MSGPWEDYQDKEEGKPWEDYRPKKASAAEQVANDAISKGARDFVGQGSDALGGVSQHVLNLLAGGVRGAGSIGATIARPFESGQENEARRKRIDENMRSVGADPDSWMYKGGKIGGEIAGTAGAGNVLANGVRMAVPAVQSMQGMNALNAVTRGLESGGFRVGDALSPAAQWATRIGTGSAVGGTAAGMVDPKDAQFGAMVGGALPAVSAAVGRAGDAIGSTLRRGPTATPEIVDTARKSMDAGYIIPPSMIDPSFKNRAIEGLSGKFETAQLAATNNQGVTDSLVRKALNLPANAPLTKDALDTYRKVQYATGYEPVKQLGAIPAGQKFNDALDDIVKQYTGKGTIPAMAKDKQAITELVASHKSTGFDSADAIDAIKGLRESADEAFRKGEGALGKTYKAIANAYEASIDDTLSAIGQRDLLKGYRDARANIAKSFTVDKGLREGAGTVDARALARELQKGKPLTGELRTAAEFGNTFNKAAQPPHMIGSPGVSALRPLGAMATSAIGGASMGPAGLALGALNYAMPPAARAAMFSNRYQRGLLDVLNPASDELGLLTQGAYRAAPLLSGQ